MLEIKDEILEKYMLPVGEGETMASQMVTAVNKLVYKWWNDGDVFDNTYHLEGWANDLSSYANWIWRYSDDDVRDILEGIREVRDDDGYENLLDDLITVALDERKLEELANKPRTVCSIYKCGGQFKFIDKILGWEGEGFADEDW